LKKQPPITKHFEEDEDIEKDDNASKREEVTEIKRDKRTKK